MGNGLSIPSNVSKMAWKTPPWSILESKGFWTPSICVLIIQIEPRSSR